MPNKLLNFRCPPDLLEAIDALGVQRYPIDNDNKCDRTKTLLDIISAGIQALNDGSVNVPVSNTQRKTISQTKCKTDFDLEELKAMLRAELASEIKPVLEDFNERLKKLRA